MNLKFKVCTFENCNNKHKGHGYCIKHYFQFKKGTLGKVKIELKCLVCDRKHSCKGYCNKHYQRNKKGLPLNMVDYTKNEYARGNVSFQHKDSNSWSKAIKQVLKDKCAICGWQEAPCDVHHIIPKSKGGLNSLSNGIVLCPNHHKLADIGKITVVELQQINSSLVNN